MKCISDGEYIYNVKDKEAYRLVEEGYTFVPRSEWKKYQPKGCDGVKNPRKQKVKMGGNS